MLVHCDILVMSDDACPTSFSMLCKHEQMHAITKHVFFIYVV